MALKLTSQVKKINILNDLRTGFAKLVFTVFYCSTFMYLAFNPELVTITFTNIGFAVFLALANTCFSWARTYTGPQDDLIAKRINRLAYYSISCAVLFILSSFIQFLIIAKNIVTGYDLGDYVFFKILSVIRYTLLAVFLFVGFSTIIELILILVKLFFTEHVQIPKKTDED